jgi:hypothetical protein
MKIGRLALRQEGADWNAYYALPDTMEGARPLGSIKLSIVMANPALKAGFMTLMREVVADLVQRRTGLKLDWRAPEVAPEHERSGNA